MTYNNPSHAHGVDGFVAVLDHSAYGLKFTLDRGTKTSQLARNKKPV
jgi:hypothetical protein